jgi:hypothetical protein
MIYKGLEKQNCIIYQQFVHKQMIKQSEKLIDLTINMIQNFN